VKFESHLFLLRIPLYSDCSDILIIISVFRWIVGQLASLAVTESGNILCADFISRQIHTFTEHGQYLSGLDCSAFVAKPTDVAILPGGKSSSESSRIKKEKETIFV